MKKNSYLLMFVFFCSSCIHEEINTQRDVISQKVSDTILNLGLNAENLISVYDFYDNQLSHSQIIENAIEFSSVFTDRILVFDKINWNIDRAILLSSNTAVIIDDVTIKQNDFVFDNVFRGDNLVLNSDDLNGIPLKIKELTNIKIIGLRNSQIIGCDNNAKIFNPYLQKTEEAVGDYYGWRTLQISLTNCVGVEISGIKFTQTRCWCISIDMSKDIKIHDLVIKSNVKNGDGIDIRKGCSNFDIYNIIGDTSDDLVAITALPSNMDYSARPHMYPMVPSTAILSDVFGLEGGIYNGRIRNIKKAGKYHAVIVLASGGRWNRDIYINEVEEIFARARSSLVRVYTSYGKGYKAGDISNIRIDNINAIGFYSKAAVYCNTKISNSWINNVSSINGNAVLLDVPEGVTVTNNY